MQIVLVDRQKSLIDEWAKVFSGIDSVTIRHDSVFEMSCDALVSPANSFGFMDGGLDWAISEFFGWHVQKRLQQIIQAKYHGELLVGMAEIVPTD
ncbi:MAG TPA: Appr-1-p processing protein, partial [Anaerolineae bacterium]|nr:Appr-1-p processing protein [Anaerolineae bacterium]